MLKPALATLTLLAGSAISFAATPALTRLPDPESSRRLPSVASPDPAFSDPTNAALLYYRAFMFILPDKMPSVVNAVASDDPNWRPDAELTKTLKDSDNAIFTFIRASKMDSADFGIEYSQGIGALLPHLGKMREGARLLAADAHRAVAEGKPDEAAERVAAMFGLSRHCVQDRLLISSLVSVAIHFLACQQVEYLINSGQMTAAGKKQLAAAMDRFNTPDPWGVKNSIRGERHWVVVWIRGQLAQPDGLKTFTSQVLPLLDDKPDSEDIKAIQAMDAAGVSAELDKADAYYTAAISSFDQPEGEQRLKDLGDRVASGEFGIIGKHTLPAMSRAYSSNAKAMTRQTETRNKLANFIAPGN